MAEPLDSLLEIPCEKGFSCASASVLQTLKLQLLSEWIGNDLSAEELAEQAVLLGFSNLSFAQYLAIKLQLLYLASGSTDTIAELLAAACENQFACVKTAPHNTSWLEVALLFQKSENPANTDELLAAACNTGLGCFVASKLEAAFIELVLLYDLAGTSDTVEELLAAAVANGFMGLAVSTPVATVALNAVFFEEGISPDPAAPVLIAAPGQIEWTWAEPNPAFWMVQSRASEIDDWFSNVVAAAIRSYVSSPTVQYRVVGISAFPPPFDLVTEYSNIVTALPIDVLDTFDSYTAGLELNGLNGGTDWDAAYVSRGALEPATDNFDSYSAGADLAGLNLGIFWNAAYVSRANPEPATDNFDSYSDTADLNGLDAGDNWEAAYVSRP